MRSLSGARSRKYPRTPIQFLTAMQSSRLSPLLRSRSKARMQLADPSNQLTSILLKMRLHLALPGKVKRRKRRNRMTDYLRLRRLRRWRKIAERKLLTWMLRPHRQRMMATSRTIASKMQTCRSCQRTWGPPNSQLHYLKLRSKLRFNRQISRL